MADLIIVLYTYTYVCIVTQLVVSIALTPGNPTAATFLGGVYSVAADWVTCTVYICGKYRLLSLVLYGYILPDDALPSAARALLGTPSSLSAPSSYAMVANIDNISMDTGTGGIRSDSLFVPEPFIAAEEALPNTWKPHEGIPTPPPKTAARQTELLNIEGGETMMSSLLEVALTFCPWEGRFCVKDTSVRKFIAALRGLKETVSFGTNALENLQDTLQALRVCLKPMEETSWTSAYAESSVDDLKHGKTSLDMMVGDSEAETIVHAIRLSLRWYEPSTGHAHPTPLDSSITCDTVTSPPHSIFASSPEIARTGVLLASTALSIPTVARNACSSGLADALYALLLNDDLPDSISVAIICGVSLGVRDHKFRAHFMYSGRDDHSSPISVEAAASAQSDGSSACILGYTSVVHVLKRCQHGCGSRRILEFVCNRVLHDVALEEALNVTHRCALEAGVASLEADALDEELELSGGRGDVEGRWLGKVGEAAARGVIGRVHDQGSTDDLRNWKQKPPCKAPFQPLTDFAHSLDSVTALLEGGGSGGAGGDVEQDSNIFSIVHSSSVKDFFNSDEDVSEDRKKRRKVEGCNNDSQPELPPVYYQKPFLVDNAIPHQYDVATSPSLIFHLAMRSRTLAILATAAALILRANALSVKVGEGSHSLSVAAGELFCAVRYFILILLNHDRPSAGLLFASDPHSTQILIKALMGGASSSSFNNGGRFGSSCSYGIGDGPQQHEDSPVTLEALNDGLAVTAVTPKALALIIRSETEATTLIGAAGDGFGLSMQTKVETSSSRHSTTALSLLLQQLWRLCAKCQAGKSAVVACIRVYHLLPYVLKGISERPPDAVAPPLSLLLLVAEEACGDLVPHWAEVDQSLSVVQPKLKELAQMGARDDAARAVEVLSAWRKLDRNCVEVKTNGNNSGKKNGIQGSGRAVNADVLMSTIRHATLALCTIFLSPEGDKREITFRGEATPHLLALNLAATIANETCCERGSSSNQFRLALIKAKAAQEVLLAVRIVALMVARGHSASLSRRICRDVRKELNIEQQHVSDGRNGKQSSAFSDVRANRETGNGYGEGITVVAGTVSAATNGFGGIDDKVDSSSSNSVISELLFSSAVEVGPGESEALETYNKMDCLENSNSTSNMCNKLRATSGMRYASLLHLASQSVLRLLCIVTEDERKTEQQKCSASDHVRACTTAGLDLHAAISVFPAACAASLGASLRVRALVYRLCRVASLDGSICQGLRAVSFHCLSSPDHFVGGVLLLLEMLPPCECPIPLHSLSYRVLRNGTDETLRRLQVARLEVINAGSSSNPNTTSGVSKIVEKMWAEQLELRVAICLESWDEEASGGRSSTVQIQTSQQQQQLLLLPKENDSEYLTSKCSVNETETIETGHHPINLVDTLETENIPAVVSLICHTSSPLLLPLVHSLATRSVDLGPKTSRSIAGALVASLEGFVELFINLAGLHSQESASFSVCRVLSLLRSIGMKRSSAGRIALLSEGVLEALVRCLGLEKPQILRSVLPVLIEFLDGQSQIAEVCRFSRPPCSFSSVTTAVRNNLGKWHRVDLAIHALGARLLAGLATSPVSASGVMAALQPYVRKGEKDRNVTMLLPRLYIGLINGLEDLIYKYRIRSGLEVRGPEADRGVELDAEMLSLTHAACWAVQIPLALMSEGLVELSEVLPLLNHTDGEVGAEGGGMSTTIVAQLHSLVERFLGTFGETSGVVERKIALEAARERDNNDNAVAMLTQHLIRLFAGRQCMGILYNGCSKLVAALEHSKGVGSTGIPLGISRYTSQENTDAQLSLPMISWFEERDVTAAHAQVSDRATLFEVLHSYSSADGGGSSLVSGVGLGSSCLGKIILPPDEASLLLLFRKVAVETPQIWEAEKNSSPHFSTRLEEAKSVVRRKLETLRWTEGLVVADRLRVWEPPQKQKAAGKGVVVDPRSKIISKAGKGVDPRLKGQRSDPHKMR